MSSKNGAKQFIYVVRSVREGRERFYLVRSDHDPERDELIAVLRLQSDEEKASVECQRYDMDALPVVPPKKP